MRTGVGSGRCVVVSPVRVSQCGAYVGAGAGAWWNGRRVAGRLGARFLRALSARPTRLALPRRRALVGDTGMTTAEYAVGTVGAAALGAVMYRIVTGNSVTHGIEDLIMGALRAPF